MSPYRIDLLAASFVWGWGSTGFGSRRYRDIVAAAGGRLEPSLQRVLAVISQIDVQVAHAFSATKKTLAVTGGTGIYAGVTGWARGVDTGPGTADRTFYLIRPGQG